METKNGETLVEVVTPATEDEVHQVFGPNDANRKLIEQLLECRMTPREGAVAVRVLASHKAVADNLIIRLLAAIREGRPLTAADVRHTVREAQRHSGGGPDGSGGKKIVATRRGTPIWPKTEGQKGYVEAVGAHDMTFCIGPAGTGKTYLAMAMAVSALRDKTVGRIVLTRPIVEAGEALGFLPGDIMDKVDPYLRPLHDALHDIMGGDKFRRNLERNTIEVIPLAYMRGRTLNDAFIVLDEAQNTTSGQMKMALTRMGFGSKMIVTGDVTQTDLPTHQESGLLHAVRVLRELQGIAFVELTARDIVRHDLVQAIVAAYEDNVVEAKGDNEEQEQG